MHLVRVGGTIADTSGFVLCFVRSSCKPTIRISSALALGGYAPKSAPGNQPHEPQRTYRRQLAEGLSMLILLLRPEPLYLLPKALSRKRLPPSGRYRLLDGSQLNFLKAADDVTKMRTGSLRNATFVPTSANSTFRGRKSHYLRRRQAAPKQS